MSSCSVLAYRASTLLIRNVDVYKRGADVHWMEYSASRTQHSAEREHVELNSDAGATGGGFVSEAVDLCYAGALVLGDVEEDASAIVADEADALQGIFQVARSQMGRLFDAESCNDGAHREGGNGVEDELFVEVKDVGMTGSGFCGVNEDASGECVAFLDRGMEHCYICGWVSAKYKIVYPRDSAESEDLIQYCMGVRCRRYWDAELVHLAGEGREAARR